MRTWCRPARPGRPALLSQVRHRPIVPIHAVQRDVLIVKPPIPPGYLRVLGQVEQEPPHKRVQIALLFRRKLAVRVVRRDAVAHVPGDPEGGVHRLRRGQARVRAWRAEPVVAPVLEAQQGAGRDQARELVVVEGQQRGPVGGEVVEGRGEPHVLRDDLVRGLGGVALGEEGVGDAPAVGAAGAGFLREGEGDAGVEGPRDEGAFAVARTARHAEAVGVHLGCRRGGDGVDDARDGPGVGHEGAGRGVAAVEVVEFADAARGGVVLLGDVGAAEGDEGDVGGLREAAAVETYERGVWGVAGGWVGDCGVEGDRVGGHGACN